MAKGFYVPVSRLSKKAKKWYVPVGGFSKEVKAAYCSVSGLSKQFYGGGATRVIFFEGVFSYVPNGVDIENNIEDTDKYISSLCFYFDSNKTLWVHDISITPEWIIDDDLCIDSEYEDYVHQVAKNAIYIPVNKLSGAQRLRITAKGNLMFQACYVNTAVKMIEGDKAYICSTSYQTKTVDISNLSEVGYVKLSLPDTIFASNENITNPSLYQPVPFERNYAYTNPATNGLPGIEFDKDTGDDDIYIVAKYREPDGAQTHFYIFSKSPFTAILHDRRFNGGQDRQYTLTGSQILSDPSVYMWEIELVNYGYHFSEEWHTNYAGSWNTNWDKELGQIVLYGHATELDPPSPGTYSSLQNIKKIEIIGGDEIIPTPWEYSKSDAGQFVTISNRAYTKVNNGLAYYAVYVARFSNGYWAVPLLVSETESAVYYSNMGAVSGTVIYKNKTWYVSGTGWAIGLGSFPSVVPEGCYLTPTSADVYNTNLDLTDAQVPLFAALQLLKRV